MAEHRRQNPIFSGSRPDYKFNFLFLWAVFATFALQFAVSVNMRGSFAGIFIQRRCKRATSTGLVKEWSLWVPLRRKWFCHIWQLFSLTVFCIHAADVCAPITIYFLMPRCYIYNILLLQQGAQFMQSPRSSFQAEIIHIWGQGENFPTQKGNDVALLSDQPK